MDRLSSDTTQPGLDAADLTAWDWAFRRPDDVGLGPLYVQGLPSHTSPDWQIAQEDIHLIAWSPDDSRIVSKDQPSDDERDSHTYRVYRASDGALQLAVHNATLPRASWETDSRLLLLTRLPGTEGTYQLIRCTLAGNCSRVGPRSTGSFYNDPDSRAAIIPATRRNS